ncbi:synaptotagmin-4-like [Larus michahellis]|uniref:synaptotagmin-4-like n=1 Tax=Larus michahellis TaxID=119627 RepID=UPI003D9B8727
MRLVPITGVAKFSCWMNSSADFTACRGRRAVPMFHDHPPPRGSWLSEESGLAEPLASPGLRSQPIQEFRSLVLKRPTCSYRAPNPAGIPTGRDKSQLITRKTLVLWAQPGEEVHFQVFLGVGLALLCLSILLGCTVCWWHRWRPGPRLGWKWATVGLGPSLPARTVPAPIQQHYEEVAGEMLGAGAEKGPPVSPASHRGLLHGRTSLPSLPFSPKPAGAWQRRCTISGANLLCNEEDLLDHPVLGPPTPLSSSTGPKQRPQLHCNLFYSPAKATLTVMVLGLSHLPKGLRGSQGSYVKVYLLSQLPASRRTALQRGSLHPTHRELCRFGRYSLEELRSFTLRFAVYIRCRSLKDSFVGEVLFPCAQATWDPRVPSSYSWELSSTKTKLRKCLRAHDLSRGVLSSSPKSLGQLFLLLQYQALASRIKVLVRKAEDLGRLSRLPGTPGHYVIIHLYHNGHVINTKETKSITGYNPVWNTPFLFNLPTGDIQQQELSLEFTVMQARIYTHSSPLGRVQVGPRAPGAGLLHWKEMCSQGQLESARWHRIQPNALGR